MRRKGKMALLMLLLSMVLTAGSISGEVTVTGNEAVICDLLLFHNTQPLQVAQMSGVISGEEYIFMGLAPGNYLLQVIPQSQHYEPEFYEDATNPEEAEPIIINNNTPSVTGIDFELEYMEMESCEVSGTVLVEGGEPAAALEVYLYGVFNNYWNTYLVETDGQGAFSFEQVAPGSYIMFLEHLPGYHHYFWENSYSMQQADIILLGPGEIMAGLILEMQPLPSFSLSGTVYETESGSTFPLSGALVSGYAVNCWGEGEYFQTLTDEYGHYSTSLSGGMYWLYCHKAGYPDQYWENAASFDDATPLHLNGEITGIDFVLEGTGDPQNNSVSGFITQEGEEPGFPCMVIVIASDEDDDWSETTISESSGYYYLDEIPAGNYYVVMMTSSTPPVYYPEGYDWEAAEEVYIEGNVTDINFALDEMNSNGVFLMEGEITGESREGVSGASVVFFDEAGMPASYGISGADGSYSAYSLEAGSYSVLAGKTYYESENLEVIIAGDSELDIHLIKAATSFEEETIPAAEVPLSCYPNPVFTSGLRSSVSIKFTPKEAGACRLSVYNLRGQLLENIYTGWLAAEPQILSWEPESGESSLNSGVYFISFEQSGKVTAVQKLLLLK